VVDFLIGVFMKKETVFETMDDGKQIALHMWVPDTKINTIIQISHGMAEYALRYDRFATFLGDYGIAIYAHDHRGHGQTAVDDNELGFIAEKNGFNRVVEDLHFMIRKCKTDFPDAKCVLFGHSFGSFVTQAFIERYGSELDGCILCGTAGPNLAVAKGGKMMAAIISFFKGTHYRSQFLDTASFGNYNKKITDAKTNFDWLSRDETEVKKYINSKYCGFLCSASFFYDITYGLCLIHTKKAMACVPKKLPIFFIDGGSDPVGNYTKSVLKLIKVYKHNGVENVAYKFYPLARHELLNEINRNEVMEDILNWTKKLLS
jgi:alpha-beta hydrolase superfamily lysophospholipase